MKAIIYILGLVLMTTIVTAITFTEIPEITLSYDSELSNVDSPYDNNIYSVFCDKPNTNICNVYRTDVKHTTLIGE